MAKRNKNIPKGFVMLNLRGSYFEIKASVLKELSEQSLFWTEILMKDYDLKKNNLDTLDIPVIYVDRNPMLFHFLLDYLSQVRR